MALGADCIDDCDVLRAGRTRRLLGGWIAAPSTLGTFLRAFTFGHVRQLDRVSGVALTRAWSAGAGPGCGRLVVDIDSFIGEVHGYGKQGAAFGYTGKRGYHPMLATRADTGEVLHVRLRKGSAASPTRRAALRRRAARPHRSRRRDRREAASAATRRFGTPSSWPGCSGPAGSTRSACAANPRSRTRSPRSTESAWQPLADYPAGRRSADRRNDRQRQAPGRASHPADRRASRAVPRLATLRVLDQPHRADSRSSRPSIASTPSSSSRSATSKTKRSRTSPPATTAPTAPGP